MTTEVLNVGVVGAVGRGMSFGTSLKANNACVYAVCDVNAEKLDWSMRELGAREKYTNYEEMLDKARLDAVIIGTPMQFHARQSIQALERGIHVLCEVTASVSIEECRQLVLAANKSTAIYMMAENYTYMKPNVFVRELARQGLFGQVYYAEGEYIHEYKAGGESTPWRRKWQTGLAGVTYGTHSLGPILQWMPGDRVVRVCCEDTDYRSQDPHGEPFAQTTPIMLCKTAQGALIKIRVDMISDRPHAVTNYSLQGSDGVYESSRWRDDKSKLWLRSLSREMAWLDLDSLMNLGELADRYLPADWRNPPPEALAGGHGGGDLFEIRDFILAATGRGPCPIGIHEAMDMTLPGLVSQLSILDGGRWMDVPDSRTWGSEGDRPQLQMLLPAEAIDRAPKPVVPPGYSLREFVESDAPRYLALMHGAGFTDWTAAMLKTCLTKVLPGGFFVIEHLPGKTIVATAMVSHNPNDQHPHGAEVGWVAADSNHRGKGLGAAVTAAAALRAILAGYTRVYLLTDDWRLPAIKTYLKLGFQPYVFSDELGQRWDAVLKRLN